MSAYYIVDALGNATAFPTGSGSTDLTHLNASNLTSGTIPDARLPNRLNNPPPLFFAEEPDITEIVVPFPNDPPWVNTPYSAGDYTASGSMTWTVNVGSAVTNRTKLIGNKTLLWRISVFASTVGGVAGNELRIALPFGYAGQVGGESIVPLARVIDNGAIPSATCFAQIAPGITGNKVRIMKNDFSNWALSAAGTDLYFQMILELQ